MTAVIIIVLLVVAFFGFAVYRGVSNGKANVSAGVVAQWEGLRATRTELIQGYGANAQRCKIKGLTARVEDSGTNIRKSAGRRDDRKIHVIIEGPGTAIVKTARAAGSYKGDQLARQFVATFNMLSKA